MLATRIRLLAVVVGVLFFVLIQFTPIGSPSRPASRPAPAKVKHAKESLPDATATRNPKWATPINNQDLPNLHRVSDDLYRGAQPTAAGMAELKRMGVKTVFNLRTLHSDRDEIGDTGLAYEHVRFNPLNPEDDEVVLFLQTMLNPDRVPVFVHCMQGVDRTGTMCAVYRIAVQGWSKEEAIEEMTEGFGMHRNLYANLLTYIQKLDIQGIMRRVEAGRPIVNDQPEEADALLGQ